MNSYKKYNQKFILTQENLSCCIDKVISKMKPNLNFSIDIMKSPVPKSNSLYVRCLINNCYCLLRISDHDTYLTEEGGSNNYINVIVGHTTKQFTICQAIDNLIRRTERKRLNYILFKNIKSIRGGKCQSK